MYNVNINKLTSILSNNIFDYVYSKIKKCQYKFGDFQYLKTFCKIMHEALQDNDYEKIKSSLVNTIVREEKIRHCVRIMRLISKNKMISDTDMAYIEEELEFLEEYPEDTNDPHTKDKFGMLENYCDYVLEKLNETTYIKKSYIKKKPQNPTKHTQFVAQLQEIVQEFELNHRDKYIFFKEHEEPVVLGVAQDVSEIKPPECRIVSF